MKLFNLKSQKLGGSTERKVFVANPGMGLLVLFGMFIAMSLILSVINGVVFAKIGQTTASIRILSVLQDLLVFIMPAIVTAVVATKLPASFLRIDVGVSAKTMFMALVVLVCATPAMNFIIELNKSMSLPPFLESVEQWMRQSEDSAAEMMKLLFGGTSVGDLIMSVLIVGVLAGFSEELFFRGALQHLIRSMKLGPQTAIWIAAFIFSAMHLQFYGFVPRLLLGAFFGYIVWWSGSLWCAVLVHVLNNVMVVFFSWLSELIGVENITETAGASINFDVSSITLVLLSVAVTVFGMIILRRNALKSRKDHSIPVSSTADTIENHNSNLS